MAKMYFDIDLTTAFLFLPQQGRLQGKQITITSHGSPLLVIIEGFPVWYSCVESLLLKQNPTLITCVM